jgi:C-terminal processing protease CtpA/Prc
MIGLPTDLSQGIDDKAIIVQPAEVMIQSVEKDTPADQAGLKYGDVILSINNESIKNTSQMQEKIKNIGGESLQLVIKREKQELSLEITPSLIKDEQSPRLGVALADAGLFGILGILLCLRVSKRQVLVL